MLRIAVVDDDASELNIIYKTIVCALENRQSVYHIDCFSSANAFLKVHEHNPFDAVFLDIDMPQISGMDAAEILNQSEYETEIVFVTHHDELVYKAYRFKALGFIRKKQIDSEIDEILDILLQTVRRKKKFLEFQDAGKLLRIKLDDIIFIQSDDHYAEVFTIYGKETVRQSLNTIEEVYGDLGFLRIHMRYLVYYKYIYSIEKNIVILHDNKQLPLSRSRSNEVKQQFQKYARRI